MMDGYFVITLILMFLVGFVCLGLIFVENADLADVSVVFSVGTLVAFLWPLAVPAVLVLFFVYGLYNGIRRLVNL